MAATKVCLGQIYRTRDGILGIIRYIYVLGGVATRYLLKCNDGYDRTPSVDCFAEEWTLVEPDQ